MIFLDLPQQTTPPPAPPPLVYVKRAEDQAPLILMGFVAFGENPDLAKLDAAATAAGLRAGRVTTTAGPMETMIAFQPGVSRPAALQVYHDALNGKFGKLRIEAVIVTTADARDGIDFDTEARIVSPAAIVE